MNLDAPAVTALKTASTPAKFLEWAGSHLDWPIALGDFEAIDDLLYDFTAADLDIKPGEFAKIRSLRQMPPLEDNQPWGIFLVEFEARRFSITALRKILSRLVPSRRNSLFHPVWNAKDLLFVCFWGTGADRTVCLARFAEEPGGLSSVRTVHCAPAAEDPAHLMRFADRLAPLRWPPSGTSAEDWHKAWDKAFATRWRAVITSSEVLAGEMADLAIEIHDRVLDALRVETDDGFAHRLFRKVKDTLLHDVHETQFADMYAQTIVYGLFSARCLDTTPDTFSVKEAISLIPNTNPFLKGLMKDCFADRQRGGLSFDELGIGDVVDLFANVDAARIAADFGRRTGGGREDPVIYFYEEFLKRYDSAQKIACGEFYTPQPVVAFIVRAVDTLLKTRFDLPDGLATSTTRTLRRPVGASTRTRPEPVPAVQILDPATGTGTFLRQIILGIHATFARNYRKNHPAATPADIAKAWSDYVDTHLLPRLNGFELMMAPYAIAHMKLAMVLQDTGYDFQGNGRLRVFLTNSLEEPGNANPQLALWNDPLALESIEANAVKKNPAINIVIGNPPYSIASDNRGAWILSLIKDYKKDLNEKKLNLDDDYIKFIRLGQEYVNRSGQGILAYISNNSFIDGITHRRMRQSLLETFDEIFIFDLHGNARKKEICPDGTPDKNVFEIMQGVSISIFVKTGTDQPCTVRHAELFGDQKSKYDALACNGMDNIPWRTLQPHEPNFFFIPKDFSLEEEYQQCFPVDGLFTVGGLGVKTERDEVTVHFDLDSLKEAVEIFRTGDVRTIREKFGLGKDSRDWSVERAKSDIVAHYDYARYAKRFSYRVFDKRYIYYTGVSKGFVGTPGFALMRHMLNKNIALCVIRNSRGREAALPFVADTLVGKDEVSSLDNCRVFPLYLYEETLGSIGKRANLSPSIVSELESRVGRSVKPEEVFGWVYGVLHSGAYREKYKDFLKVDFPRVPWPRDGEEFAAVSALGWQLAQIHVMADFPEARDVKWKGDGGRDVEKARWSDGAVWVNAASRFEGVDEATWAQWIGGYQPLQKWLKDRKHRTLSPSDISHYKRMVQALRRTRELMDEIDKVCSV